MLVPFHPEALSPFPLLRPSFSVLYPALLAQLHFHGHQHRHPSCSCNFSFFLQGGMTAGFLSACLEPCQLQGGQRPNEMMRLTGATQGAVMGEGGSAQREAVEGQRMHVGPALLETHGSDFQAITQPKKVPA